MGKTTDLIAVNELTVVRTRLRNAAADLQKKCEARSVEKNLTNLPTKNEHALWFNTEHDATGNEINKLITEIQNVWSNDAEQRNSLLQNLIDVYTIIDKLDSEYLSKIEKLLDQINDNYERIKENTKEIWPLR